MPDEEFPTTANGIADAITADLTAMDTAATPPAPEEAAAPEESTPSPTAAPETPAPAPPEDAPAGPLKLTDTSIVIDPVDGTEKTWGEIKAERFRHKDYTQKRMADAEKVRQLEANEAKRQAAFDAWQAKAKADSGPELPADDPYAIRIKAVEAQAKYLAEIDKQRQADYDEQAKALKLKESTVALKQVEERIAKEYGLSEEEVEIVESQYYRRRKAGEHVTIDTIAKARQGYLSSLKEEAVKEFKEKHRVAAPVAAASIPAAGTPESLPVPGSRGFLDAIREEVGALMR